jgi:hypothetical protein
MSVTGELPFKSLGPVDAWMRKLENQLATPRELVPSLSERLDWAIRRAMSGDPNRRPATCREFVEDLTGRSTRRTRPTVEEPGLWYVLYKDARGMLRVARGGLHNIRRHFREGTLGYPENARAARTKEGPFRRLRKHPELRDLVVSPAPAAVPAGPAEAAAPVGVAAEPQPPADPLRELEVAPGRVRVARGQGGGQGARLGWVLLLLGVATAVAVAGLYVLQFLR